MNNEAVIENVFGIYKIKNKLGDPSQGPLESSLFNSFCSDV